MWPANQSRNATDLLETDRSTTLIWPTDVCQTSQDSSKQIKPKIYLLVIVCSAVKNFQERQVIRDTWAKDQVNNYVVRLGPELADLTLSRSCYISSNGLLALVASNKRCHGQGASRELPFEPGQ